MCQHSPLALLHLHGFNYMSMTWIFNCLLGIFQHVKGKVFFLKAPVKVSVYGFDLCPFLNQLLHLLLLLLRRFSRVRLCATPETAAHQAPRPWDSPGKNTGVGCHFLLQCMKVESESEVAQSCPTLATPWTAAYQAPPSMGFSRQKYWSGVPLPSTITVPRAM